jgi:hypothetical protein
LRSAFRALVVSAALLGYIQTAQACTNFIGMNIAEGEVGKHAHAQIWNPADSGVTLSVTGLCFAAMPINGAVLEHTGGDVTTQNIPYGAEGVNQGYCTNVSDTNPAKARMRSVRLPPGVGNGVTGVKPFAEIWTGKSGEDHCYQFKNPMIVPPGYGLTARGAGEASTVISTWQWSELAP